MESGLIPNDRISASSRDTDDDAPQFARLHGPWAWMPQQLFNPDKIKDEYLQVSILKYFTQIVSNSKIVTM